MIRFLAENKDYKVYSSYENVYLKNKAISNNLNEFEKADKLITSHYGDPNNAIIMHSNEHIIVSGCGLSIYDIAKDAEKHILAEPDQITWTNGVYQDATNDELLEFRFVALNKNENFRVFKMNVKTFKIIEL